MIGSEPGRSRLLLRREWLVTNGLGGYASGTIAGVPTRRYHGLLIAALPAPLGRMVMLRHLCEQLRFLDGTVVQIGGEERAENDLEVPAANYLTELRLENGLPVWRYQVGETILETRLLRLSFAKTPSGGPQVDLSALIRRHCPP
jgi:predicted glycogen debranching enzyme